MSQYNIVNFKLKEYNSIKAELKKLCCDCYAVYKYSLSQSRHEFVYVTDYETEKESMDYCERVFNLVHNCPDAFVVLPAKKNATGEIFLKDYINGTESFIKYNGICKFVLTMDMMNLFTWINAHSLHAGHSYLPAEVKTKDLQPPFWIQSEKFDVETIVIRWDCRDE